MTFVVHNTYAQNPAENMPPEKLNQYDEKGKRSGLWLITVKSIKGEPPYTEVGSYIKGEKSGLWYKMNEKGNMVAIENYKRDVLDGEVKYFNNGQIAIIGKYRGLNPDLPVDTIMVVEPVTGEQTLVPVPADIGSVRHGTWRYYNTMGTIDRIEEYQIDEVIYEEVFTYTKEDSLRYQKRLQNMPDPNKSHLPKGRTQHSYINY